MVILAEACSTGLEENAQVFIVSRRHQDRQGRLSLAGPPDSSRRILNRLPTCMYSCSYIHTLVPGRVWCPLGSDVTCHQEIWFGFWDWPELHSCHFPVSTPNNTQKRDRLSGLVIVRICSMYYHSSGIPNRSPQAPFANAPSPLMTGRSWLNHAIDPCFEGIITSLV